MPSDFLPRFRRQLFDWLQLRITSGRLPFRRVEETPAIITDQGPATPDLVLWINRDSLLAGAMILIPPKTDTTVLRNARETAESLGLRQFVTWESQAVNLWETATQLSQPLKSWPMPTSRALSADDFAVTFEQLLLELKNLAVSATLPVEQLPPAYFANLCLQTLYDTLPSLQEVARIAAGPGLPDNDVAGLARDKGWLTLWRLLALLRHDRMPLGVKPERLDRALDYALAELATGLYRSLAPAADEPPLPESAAIRMYHLAGRLAQLGWAQQPERADLSLGLVFAETARDCNLATVPATDLPPAGGLLVNCLPPSPRAGDIIVAPQPCLAGWGLTSPGALTVRTFTTVTALPSDLRPAWINAVLDNPQPLPAALRRQRLTAMRQPWPYRRLHLPGNTPAWLWDALHLGGLADPEGALSLTLPPAWTAEPGADLFWALLSERLALASVQLHLDGRQTLTLTGHARSPEKLTVWHADGIRRELPLLLEDAGLAEVTALAAATPPPELPITRSRRKSLTTTEQIAARIFRDGLPRFPEDYLRRHDLPPLRTYRLPGPLAIDSNFFDRVRLSGPDGTFVDSDNPADAEALLLASRDGRGQVALPTDPALTMRLTAAYRADLRQLWQNLLTECRRQHFVQRRALAIARQIWRSQGLPPMDSL